MQKTVGRKQHV